MIWPTGYAHEERSLIIRQAACIAGTGDLRLVATVLHSGDADQSLKISRANVSRRFVDELVTSRGK